MKARRWLIAASVILGLGVVAVVAAPRLLMHAATEKPVAESTFVTRPAAAPDLRSQMNQALQNSQTNQSSNQINTGSQVTQVNPGGQTQVSTDATQTNTTPLNPQQPAPDAVNAATQPPTQDPNTSNPANPSQNQGSVPLTPAQPPAQTQSAGTPGQFQLQIRENEIASMIYNGLYNGTAPEYRPSIQGVSVQLQGGKGRITVALVPKYLPEQFAKSLPGVTKDTPTIYLGGEVGLSLANNTVSPEIYSLSLGSLRIPAPFIKAMVKQQVEQQVRQMTQLDSGQRAIFDSVDIANGAISIRGHVQ